MIILLNTSMDKFNTLAQLVIESKQDDKYKDFLKARQSGAKKIQHSAEAKGGPATLTAQHFKAKAKPYKTALEHADDADREKLYAKHATECLRKLQGWKSMTQREFQTIMGELEVWGEVYIKSVR
jgi:hypothetical protein